MNSANFIRDVKFVGRGKASPRASPHLSIWEMFGQMWMDKISWCLIRFSIYTFHRSVTCGQAGQIDTPYFFPKFEKKIREVDKQMRIVIGSGGGRKKL